MQRKVISMSSIVQLDLPNYNLFDRYVVSNLAYVHYTISYQHIRS